MYKVDYLLRHYGIAIVLVIGGLFFISKLLFGADGMLEIAQMDERLKSEEAKLSSIAAENEDLTRRLDYLSVEKMNEDYVLERAKIIYGYSGSDEMIIIDR